MPPPPRAGSPEAKRDADELERAVDDRTEDQESDACTFTRDPVVEPWLDQSRPVRIAYAAAALS